MRIDLTRVPVLPVFRWLAKAGDIAVPEMLRTFNCGIGMVVVVAPDKAAQVRGVLARNGEAVVDLGEVIPRADGVEPVQTTGSLTLA